ncbi:MAG: hypothetical protein MUC31_05060, partial [Bacteroidales bacterium]|nr:hypothetical protein [Bacteroidales bacterium]
TVDAGAIGFEGVVFDGRYLYFLPRAPKAMFLRYDTKGNKILSSNYKTGKFDGPSVEYYAGGQVKSEKIYLLDILQGPYKEYYENGLIRMTGNYENGEKKGVWITYDENGKVISKEKY